MSATKEEIEGQIVNWAKDNLPIDFTFRPYQLEAIRDVIYNNINNSKIQVMEAPTGSGKSLIAIISAGVLYKNYNKKSYILASDLSLFKQYEDCINEFMLKDFTCIKGKDNYICKENGLKCSSALCNTVKLSFSKVCDLDDPFYRLNNGKVLPKSRLSKNMNFSNMTEVFDCRYKCKYVLDLIKAANSPITIMPYALFFKRVYQENLYQIENNKYNINFSQRDLVICDEAHNLNNLVQLEFTLELHYNNMGFIKPILDLATQCKLLPDFDISVIVDYIKLAVSYDQKPEHRLKLFLIFNEVVSYFKKLADFTAKLINLAESSDVDYEFANEAISEINDTKLKCNLLYLQYGCGNTDNGAPVNFVVSNSGDDGIKFNCAKEDELVRTFFHEKVNSELLMSATIGDLDIYKEMIGASEYKYPKFLGIEVPNTFDYSKSPIYYSKKWKMSYREKAISLPNIISQVKDICTKHINHRGIIHSGSYENSKAFFKSVKDENLKSRLIPYNSSSDKRQALKLFEDSENGILIGPSLIEGLSFDDDLCRFNIIMKLPYASLADNLVKAKMNLFKDWYSLDVCSKIEQAIGRSTRNHNDWSEVYILDACFLAILHSNQVKNLTKTTLSRLVEL